MTATTARLARVVHIRERQMRVARAQLAKAQMGLIEIDTTLSRVRAFRRDFAPHIAELNGHEVRAAGEFGMRIDGLETSLLVRRAFALDFQATSSVTTLAAWQNHRAVTNLHDRASIADVTTADQRIASQRPWRAVSKRGNEL